MCHIFKGLIVSCVWTLSLSLIVANGQSKNNSTYFVTDNNDIIHNADLHVQLDNAQKGLEILLKALDNCKDSSLVAKINYKIAIIYLLDDNLDEAYLHLSNFKDYQQLINDSTGIFKADIALGNYYIQKKELSKATDIFSQALNLLVNKPYTEEIVEALLGLTEVYIKTQRYLEAKAYAQKALSISNSLNEEELKLRCFQMLSELYENLGDYQAALLYRNKSVLLKDSILRNQALYFLNKNEANNLSSVEALKNRKQQSETNDTLVKEDGNKILYVSIISLLFGFLIIFFILFRSKVILSKKLKIKNTELEKLNATKDKFFSIIAHDLKSPFNSLLGFSEVLSLQVENKSYKEIMSYSRSIHNSTRKLYSLVETLLQWSRTQLGTTEYKPEKLDVKILASNIISILKINAEEKDIVISVDVESDLIAWADRDLFSAVLRNLVSNAIKFSRIGSVVSVAGKAIGSNIQIAVSDTGVGISKENLQKIFRVDTNVTTAGTLNEKGTGLGLVLCKEFVEINKGIICAESKLEKGSTFKFTVPLSTNHNLN